MGALVGGSKLFRRQQEQEARELGARLLAAGWQLPELLRDIVDPARPLNEYPHCYGGRHGPEALKAARRVAQAAGERQARFQEAEQARLERLRAIDTAVAFDALTGDEQQYWHEEAKRRHPRVADNPGIVLALARQLFRERLDGAAAAAAPIAGNGSSGGPPAEK